MLLAEISTKRPVLATVLNLTIILTGIVSFFKLELRRQPDIAFPVITIESSYPGGSPSFIEKNVTNILESYIKNAKNLDKIESYSSFGSSEINIIFDLNADIDKSLNDVRSKVSEAISNLPEGISSPIISKMDVDNFASMWITATANNYDPMVLSDLIRQRVNPEFEKLSTISRSQLISNNFYTIQIKLDPTKLYQYRINPSEVKDAISKQSRDYPVGSIRSKTKNFILMLEGAKNSPEEFKEIIIGKINDKIIKISDVAEVVLEPPKINNLIRYNGVDTVAMGLIKSSKANVLELSDQVHNELNKLKKILPEEIILNIAYDASVPVRASIKSVYITAIESLILVLLVVYFFLGSISATIVPFVAIPVSLIGTFSFMYAANFSINLYTLLAMIMAIGLVVDDAIVMLENIYFHIERGLKPFDAAIKASKEIGFTIVAMTLTLVAVFLPIGFLDGFVGKLFIEFAWTLAFCVLVSGFVALTLSPSISARILKKENQKSKPSFIIKFDEYLKIITNKYAIALNWVFNNSYKILGISLISIIILISAFFIVPKEFMPEEDDAIMLISGSSPDGASIEYTLNAVKEVEEIISSTPEVKGYFFNAYGSGLFGFIPLKNWSDRNRSQQKVVSTVNNLLMKIPEAEIYAVNPSSMRGSFEKAISFNLVSFDDFNILEDLSKKFVEEMKKEKIFKAPKRNLKTSMPTINLNINSDIAARNGVFLNQIGPTLQYLLTPTKVADFSVGNEKYDVLMSFKQEDRENISDLSKIYIKSTRNQMVPLYNIVDINENVSIQTLQHYNTAKSIALTTDMDDNYSLKDAKNAIQKIADKIIDPKKTSLIFTGQINDMDKSFASIILTFILAILFIYLVLCAQFESYIDPFIIILAVPFSITGGVIALIIGGSSLNLYSNIGLITLIGLITKNSIMIVEFANKLKSEGKETIDAIISASQLRMRPILMTTSATILGSVPLVMAHGASAASRSSIGLVIFGGMLIGTIFTLFIIPSIYYKLKK